MYPLETGNENSSEKKKIPSLLWESKDLFFSNQRKILTMYTKHSKFATIKLGGKLMPNMIKNRAL